MNKLLFFMLLLSCGLADNAFGENEDEKRSVPPPEPPFIALPRPGTEWEVTISYPGASPQTNNTAIPAAVPSGKRAEKITYRRGAEITHIVATWSDGTRSDGYVVGKVYLAKFGARINALPTQDGDLIGPVFTSGYPATGWLASSNYKGIESISKGEKPVECYKFVREERAYKEDGDLVLEAGAPQVTALIHVGDKTPSSIKIGATIYSYSPIRTAPLDVQLPPEYQQALQQVRKEQKAREAMARLIQKP